MSSVKTERAPARQPHPWFTLLWVVGIVLVAFGVPSIWLTRQPLLLESVGFCVSLVVFVVYTAIYGRVSRSIPPRSVLTVLLLLSPWLPAAVNVWGLLVPSVLATPAALTALLTAFAIGAAEELLFRGVLFRAFQGRSRTLYVLTSSVVFGVLHFEQGIQGVMVTTIVGGSYSLARVAGAPLWLLIACHAVTNFPGLLPHTPHPHYPFMCSIVVAVVTGLGVWFLYRRKEYEKPALP